MNELEKRFVREGGAANLSNFFNLVLQCFTKTGGTIDLYLSLLRRLNKKKQFFLTESKEQN